MNETSDTPYTLTDTLSVDDAGWRLTEVVWSAERIEVTVTQEHVVVDAEAGNEEPVPFRVWGAPVVVAPGTRVEV